MNQVNRKEYLSAEDIAQTFRTLRLDNQEERDRLAALAEPPRTTEHAKVKVILADNTAIPEQTEGGEHA